MKKALIGYGGHAREVMSQMGIELMCFVEDKYVCDNAIPLSEFNPNQYALMVAIGSSKDRCDIIRRLPKETKYFSWIHPTALIMDNNIKIGYGSFIGAYSVLTTNIKIGNHCILNRGNHIGHDCQIGDYFSAMPGAIVSGNCTIGNCVYIGTNSSIKENVQINDLTTIGLNSGVIHNIKYPGIYGGIPAKKIK